MGSKKFLLTVSQLRPEKLRPLTPGPARGGDGRTGPENQGEVIGGGGEKNEKGDTGWDILRKKKNQTKGPFVSTAGRGPTAKGLGGGRGETRKTVRHF